MTTHFFGLMDELMRRSLRMARAVEHMVIEACEAVSRVDDGLARRIIERDVEIDREEVVIETEVLKLMTLFQPMGADMRKLCTILKVNNDLERIADCAVNMAERAAHLDPQLIEQFGGDLGQMYPVVRRMLNDVLQAYAGGDKDVAQNVRVQDEVMDALYGQFLRKLVAEPAPSQELLAAYLDMLSVAKNLERIADHATNIAEDVIYLVTGEIVRHRRS